MVRLPHPRLAAVWLISLNAMLADSVVLPFSPISSPQLSEDSNNSVQASYPLERLPPLPPLIPIVSTAKAISEKKSPPPLPKKPHTPAKTAPHHNKAAELLKLMHVPLKISCQILRTLYNVTQGSYWSNQDGWQYVDSVAIPGSQPGRPSGRHRHGDVKISRRQVLPSTNSDSKPLRASSSDNLNHARSIVPKDKLDDGSSSSGPETHPDTHPDTMPRPPEGDSNDRPRGSRGGGGDTSSMPGANPSTELDVDNCCGWYGVVCIGPDGKFPPHWPPYDEDLISSRFTTSEPSSALRL